MNLADYTHCAFMGTALPMGMDGVVVATGMQTEIGKIAK